MGCGKAAGSEGEDEGCSDGRSTDVSMSPENGSVQAKEDGQSFQGSLCLPPEAKSMPTVYYTEFPGPGQHRPKENHPRCSLLPPRSSTGLSQDGLRSETSASGEIQLAVEGEIPQSPASPAPQAAHPADAASWGCPTHRTLGPLLGEARCPQEPLLCPGLGSTAPKPPGRRAVILPGARPWPAPGPYQEARAVPTNLSVAVLASTWAHTWLSTWTGAHPVTWFHFPSWGKGGWADRG